ncbi:MAG: ABC transporter permease, partial [Actinomycetota bacterium]
LVALPVLMAMQYLFVAGVAMLVAALNVFFRDLQHLIGIVLLVWFYATPIIYPFEVIPASVELAGYDIPARTLMGLNPMARFVEAYRDALYHGRLPSAETALFLFVVSILVFAASYLAFRRLEPRFAEEV